MRLLFVNEHREIDRVALPPSGRRVYGRPGNPLRLELSERSEPPVRAQCRLRQENGRWLLENTGGEQTFVNSLPVHERVELSQWAEIRCGAQLFWFEDLGAAESRSGAVPESDSAARRLDAAQQSLAACEEDKRQLAEKLRMAEAALTALQADEGTLRLQLSALQRQHDALLDRTEQKSREDATRHAGLLAENSQLTTQLGRASAQVQLLDKERLAAQSSASALSARFTESEAATRKLQQQLTDCRQQLDRSESERGRLHTEHRELTEEVARLARVTEAAERSAREARQSRAEVEREIRELREFREQHIDDQKEREALRLQAARARRDLADCQARLQRQLVEAAAGEIATAPVYGRPAAVTELHRQAIKALDRAVVDVNYAVHSCEERWSRSIDALANPQQRMELQRELRQISSITTNACAFLDQLHRLLPSA